MKLFLSYICNNCFHPIFHEEAEQSLKEHELQSQNIDQYLKKHASSCSSLDYFYMETFDESYTLHEIIQCAKNESEYYKRRKNR